MGVKTKVLIFGGGIGGLSAAHELIDPARAQYFDVEVIESDAVYGGKARSEDVTGIPPGASAFPGEHGFRFFPSFYRHVIDTMERIPSAFGRASVADHLVGTPSRVIACYDKPPIVMPAAPNVRNLGEIVQFFTELFDASIPLTADDILFFSKKLVRLATSCKKRRLGQFERMSWWDFLEAPSRSPAYRKYLATGLTRTLVAAKPNEINAKTGGDVLIRLLIDSDVAGHRAAVDRVLDGPTSRVWINPWVQDLTARGVTFTGGALQSLDLDATGTRISAATVLLSNGTVKDFFADHYVCALPVERMADVLDISPAVRAAGARLSGITTKLRDDVRSMTGMQFYLNRRFDDLPAKLGHQLFVDSEWALTAIAQSNFWRPPFDDLSGWGDGDVKTSFSAIASDWTTPYPGVGGKPANFSSRAELRDGTLAQLVRGLNAAPISQRLGPADVLAWNLDRALIPGPEVGAGQPAMNAMQLLVNHPDRWEKYRPEAEPSGLTNLTLASDYVRTNTDLATMEGANEAARRAVNAILHREQIFNVDCDIFELYYPDSLTADPFWKTLVETDEWLYDHWPSLEIVFP